MRGTAEPFQSSVLLRGDLPRGLIWLEMGKLPHSYPKLLITPIDVCGSVFLLSAVGALPLANSKTIFFI